MTPETIAALLAPYIAGIEPSERPRIYAQLLVYLDLILKWNAKLNLTSIRTPEDIIRRHFGEGLFVATHLGAARTLLDFGSGAGFPGLPVQLARPTLQVTLAESQGKKAAFLREAVRTLQLPTEIWPRRVESMPEDRAFDAVTLRAVDNMPAAIAAAAPRAGGKLLILSILHSHNDAPILPGFSFLDPIPLPESRKSVLLIAERQPVLR